MTAKKWNIQRWFQELRRSAVDMVCRHNYQLEQGFTRKPRGGVGATGWQEKALEGMHVGSRGEVSIPSQAPEHLGLEA